MCDEGERITKGVGGIRVSCYTPVTLLEHGRMRLQAQHVVRGHTEVVRRAAARATAIGNKTTCGLIIVISRWDHYN